MASCTAALIFRRTTRGGVAPFRLLPTRFTGLELIPSENFSSLSVMQAVGSVITNKYSEGYPGAPGARYYGGNEYIDMAETLCQKRALETFGLDPSKWELKTLYSNQKIKLSLSFLQLMYKSLSGSPSNFQVYIALLKPHERITALYLPHGGHLSHGYLTDTKKISAVSISFETMPYRLNETTGYIDYDQLEKNAMLSRPKLIVAGASVYARLYDYARIRKVCDKQKAIMLADMTHISGLVVAGVIPSPFEYADVVTTTSHKSLRGPCGAMIFFRKGLKEVDKKGQEVLYETRSTKLFFQDFRVARTITLLWATTPEYKAYQELVLKNCSRFAESLMSKGYVLVSCGTENHLVLVNLKCKPEPQSSSSVMYLQPVLEQFIDKVVMFRTLMDCTMAIQEDLELSASFSTEIDNMLDIGKISSILDRGSVLDLVAKLHSNVGKYLGHRAPIGDDALLGDLLSTNNGKIFYLDRR